MANPSDADTIIQLNPFFWSPKDNYKIFALIYKRYNTTHTSDLHFQFNPSIQPSYEMPYLLVSWGWSGKSLCCRRKRN